MEAEIGARVRARMKEKLPGTAQADIARRIDLAPDAFSRSLNGKRAFTAVELVELARILETSAHWLITGEEDPFVVRFAGRHAFDRDTLAHVPIDWDEEHRPLADVALAYVQAYGDSSPREQQLERLTANEARDRLASRSGGSFVRYLADHVEAEFGIGARQVGHRDPGDSELVP